MLTAAVPGTWTSGSVTGSSPRPAEIRWRCWSWPRGMSEAELAGGFTVPPTATVPGHLQDHYLRRVRALPVPTQRLMLLAAADPTGDATLLWRARRALGWARLPAAAADAEQLLEIGSQVRFRHPLVRSAAYAAGSPQDRRAAHLALAAATDARADPERRVWHLAAAATGPDEDVAAELEQAAGRVQARAGLAAAAAFLAAVGGVDRRRRDGAPNGPWRPPRRNLYAGAFDSALGLLAAGGGHAVDDLQRARVEQLRGQVDRASQPGRRGAGAAVARGREGWSHSICGSPGTPTSMPWSRPSSPVLWRSPAAVCSRSPERHDRLRRHREIRSSTTCFSMV